jgi:PadR family transcriptional regulator PadR
MWRDFFIGFVKLHILHHAVREPIYGLAVMAELHRHGYDLSPGTLYPLLHHMETAGYLVREDRVVKGKVRKYYGATEQGQHSLAEVREKLAELVTEIVQEQGPPSIVQVDNAGDRPAEASP